MGNLRTRLPNLAERECGRSCHNRGVPCALVSVLDIDPSVGGVVVEFSEQVLVMLSLFKGIDDILREEGCVIGTGLPTHSAEWADIPVSLGRDMEGEETLTHG